MNVSGTITDGNGNTFSDVLNFETLARMMTAGEHTGISITTETLEDGGHCFNFAITSLPEITIDADGYWLMNGVRITDVDGQQVQARGLSAYEVAVLNGFSGTELEWLNSLKGEPGVTEVQITTQKKDIYCTLLATKWERSIPFRQQVLVNGITASMNPRVDIIISDDVELGRKELNEYCKLTRILTVDGGIIAECYQQCPLVDLKLLIEVV